MHTYTFLASVLGETGQLQLSEPGEQGAGCVNEPCFDVEEMILDRQESCNKGVPFFYIYDFKILGIARAAP
jgi:hypothetical protein